MVDFIDNTSTGKPSNVQITSVSIIEWETWFFSFHGDSNHCKWWTW